MLPPSRSPSSSPISSASTPSPHATHGCIIELELTAKGQRLLKTNRDRAHAIEAQLADGPSSEQEKTIKRWLAGVATADGA